MFSTYNLIKQPFDSEQIKSLQLDLVTQPGTTVEIDWVK